MEPKIIKPNSRSEKKIIIVCMMLTGILIIIDQICKAVIEKYIDIHSSVIVIPDCFNIVKVYNSGAAWGMLQGHRWLLLMISILFFIFAVLYGRKLTEGWPERYCALALVLSGIVGNSIDRIWRGGHVVDFLDFYVGGHHWPAFNVADSAICIGVGIYVLSSIRRPEQAADQTGRISADSHNNDLTD